MALKECKECNKKVSTSADKCPNCGVKDPTTTMLAKFTQTIIGVLIFGWLCYMGGSYIADSGSSDTTNWRNDIDRVAAHVMVQGFVKDRLVSPATAEFPDAMDGFDYKERIDYQGDQTYYIDSYVDSENKLGATLRTHFTAEIKQTSADEWQLVSLNLES